VADISDRNMIKSHVSNDDLSDVEKKVLLGLDYERGHDSYDMVDCIVPSAKKAKISSFEEMITKYEKPAATSIKSYSKPVAVGNHEAWRRFTHEKSLPTNEMCRVPDISVELPANKKTNLFFNQKQPEKPISSMKRPPTVLQEVVTQLDYIFIA